MKARWSKTALIELDDIFQYISERNRPAAKAVSRRIEGLVSQLEQFPYSGHMADEPDAWALPVVRYPYVILYGIDPATDEIVILHVRHTARDQSPAKG
jgi:toxin ParE1/3/4